MDVKVHIKKADGINVSVGHSKGISVPLTGKFISGGGGGGGTGIPDGGVTTDLIADGAVTKQKLSRDVQGAINDVPSLKNQLAGLLWSSAKFAMSGGKTVHVNTNPNATIKATFTSSDLTPDTITITRPLPDNTVETFINMKEASITDTTSRASGNYTFSGKATVGDKSLTASTVLYVRNAVYKGMGASYTSIMTDAYKQTATTSVTDGSYSGKSPADGSKFFLVVPSDVSAPNASEFTMGGAPAAINKSTVTVNGITYNVFETKGSYNSGAELNLKW
jgi:hypothetical protein